MQPASTIVPTSPAETINGQPAWIVAQNDPYGWASHVFDYFSTLQNPNDDYMPNMDPNAYTLGTWNPVRMSGALGYTAGAGRTAVAVLNAPPVPKTATYIPNAGAEDIVPTQGLISLNTASAQVLASVPILPLNSNAFGSISLQTGRYSNYAMNFAADIVTYRNTYGPFRSLFDLNRVTGTSGNLEPNFQSIYGNPATVAYSNSAGNLAPNVSLLPLLPTASYPAVIPYFAGQAFMASGVTNDFFTRYGTITRISNVVTTRSDTYTVYVLVQGWSGVGTATPQVVVQRRAAFIYDRSRFTTGGMRTTNPTPIAN